MKSPVATRTVLLGLLLVLLLVMLVLAVNAGYSNIPPADIVRAILGRGSRSQNLIVRFFRLPRIVIALLAGMGFAVSGAILQGITHNPLADPGLLGINAGASLVVVIFLVYSGNLNTVSILFLPFLALAGGILIGLIIYRLSLASGKGLEPIRLVLNGVAIQAGLFAIVYLIVMKMDTDQSELLATWQSGSIWSSNWTYALALLPWIVVANLILLLRYRNLDLLLLGDEAAIGLGMNLRREKRRLLFLSVTLASASVAVSGNLSFVGLISPHISRLIFGPRNSFLLPGSALVGALLLLAADSIGRTIFAPLEIPAGIVVALIGGPYFLILLLSGKGRTSGITH